MTTTPATAADLFPHLQAMTPADLMARRKQLIGDRTDILAQPLTDSELEELGIILGLIRRKQSGPPREKPEKAPRKAKAASLDDLALD